MVAAHEALSAASGIEFVGNVEGRDLPAGVADVVVTDGFTGNVALKLMEGTARTVTAAIRDAARSNPLAALGGLLMKPALGGLRRELHPDTTGGAILLGLRGIAVVGHGSSGAEGIANAIRLAARCVEVDAVGRTAALLQRGGGDPRRARRREERVIGSAGPMTRDEVLDLVRSHLGEELEVDAAEDLRGRPASRRTSTPTRSTSTSW